MELCNKGDNDDDSRGDAVASWSVHLTLDPAGSAWALVGDIELRSWVRQFTLIVPLSTQVYKWVPVDLMLGGNPVMD